MHDAAIWPPLDVQHLGAPRHRLALGAPLRARSEHIERRQLHLRHAPRERRRQVGSACLPATVISVLDS